MGDSITDGFDTPGGYRIELFRLVNEAGKDITFVGSEQNGPTEVEGVPFPRNHEGHSGWTIGQVDEIVPSHALNVDPHIILLHIGTNDMVFSANGASGRLGLLLDQIISAQPDALLVVSSIVPMSFSQDAIAQYNTQIPQLVDQRAMQGANIIFVDQFANFPIAELADGVHPSRAGYERMASTWYNAIYEYLVDSD